MIWVLLVSQVIIGAGLLALWWRARAAPAAERGYLSEEEAQAEAFLATTVERLLHDLEDSADRATERLNDQMESLQTLLGQADERLAKLPGAFTAGPVAIEGAAIARAGPSRAAWTDQVLTLAREGLAPLQIAREVGRGETEVRLVLTQAPGGGA